jgi:hypothetical protein
MEQLPGILQRLAATNELMVYAMIALGVLTFLGLVMSILGIYRANVQHREALEVMKEIRAGADTHHREALEVMNRLGYYLFKKLGPVELP